MVGDPEKQKGELMESNLDAMEVGIFLWWGSRKTEGGVDSKGKVKEIIFFMVFIFAI